MEDSLGPASQQDADKGELKLDTLGERPYHTLIMLQLQASLRKMHAVFSVFCTSEVCLRALRWRLISSCFCARASWWD